MKNNILKILIILPLFLLTGCYNYRELNELTIATSISIEKIDNEYKLSVQVINPKKEQDTSSSNEPDFLVYTRKSSTIQECFRDIVTSSPNKIYASHLELLIIDESLAKEDISKSLDFIFRDPEIRNEIYVVVGKSKDILEVLTPLDNISSQKITNSLKSTSNYIGISNIITLSELMNNYLSKKKELALPSIELKDNNSEKDDKEILEKASTSTDIYISNISVFKNNKLLGYLTKEESIAYNFIEGNIKDTILSYDYKDGYIVNEIINCKTNLEVNPKNNKINITIEGISSINEITSKIDLTKEKNIKDIENTLNNYIENLIKESINNINTKYNSDIYGFQELYYKKDYKYYNQIKDKWYEEIFNNINIEVKSNIKLLEKGNLVGGINE